MNQPPPTAGLAATDGSYEKWQEAAHFSLHRLDDGLRYVLPPFFDGAITYLVIEHPWRLFFLVVYALILYVIRVSLQMAMERREAEARLVLLKLLDRPT